MGPIDEEVEGTVGVEGREVWRTGARGDCALGEAVPGGGEGGAGEVVEGEGFDGPEDFDFVAAADEGGDGGGGGRGFEEVETTRVRTYGQVGPNDG